MEFNYLGQFKRKFRNFRHFKPFNRATSRFLRTRVAPLVPLPDLNVNAKLRSSFALDEISTKCFFFLITRSYICFVSQIVVESDEKLLLYESMLKQVFFLSRSGFCSY